jgi:NTE family protein
MNKKIALVLSSGGARGIAHIGAIDVLEENGYEITSIVGCSMGSLVGGMYASGNYQQFKEWIFSLTKKKMLKLSDADINTSYVVKGNLLMKEMKNLMPDCLIEECKIPFAAVATDVRNEKEVLFKSGSLYDAIRASISIPIFFKPVQNEDMLLMDGALVNPFPLNHVIMNGADKIVAVNVTAKSNNEFIPQLQRTGKLEDAYPFGKRNPFILQGASLHRELLAVIQMMIISNSELMIQQNPCDLLVELPASSFQCFDFFKAKEIYEVGRRLMAEQLPKLECD